MRMQLLQPITYQVFSYCTYTKVNLEDESYDNKSIIVMPEFVDFMQVIRHKISIVSWIKDLLNTDCFLVYNKDDLKPFFFELRATFKGAFRKIVKNKNTHYKILKMNILRYYNALKTRTFTFE